MRCLYCGKELALLKRWTGGGDFCSDAHRQQYQDEYNQLALTRLLQAKPQVEEKPRTAPENPEPSLAAETAPAPAVKQAAPSGSKPKLALEAAAQPEPKPEPKAEPAVAADDRAPAAAANFFDMRPAPVAAHLTVKVAPAGFERHFQPAIPKSSAGDVGAELAPAGCVALKFSEKAWDYEARPPERRLEVREFTHAAPAASFDLKIAGITELVKTSEELMDILIFPHPPQGSPALWQEAEEHFAFPTELGSLARLAFRTTGMEENEDGPAPADRAAVSEPPRLAPAAPVKPPAAPEVRPPIARAPAAPTRVVPPPVAPDPVEQAATPPAHVEKPQEKKPAQVPRPATKPLPVTLHGLAAGRGKPVQVFSTAVREGIDVQIPRSKSLPLRPAITIEPAPPGIEEKKAEENRDGEKKAEEKKQPPIAKTDPRRAQPSRPEPRFANGKGRKSDPHPVELEKKEDRPAAAAKPKEDPAVESKPVVVEKDPPKPEPPKETPAPAPEFGFSMPDSGNFWTRLPLPGKIGVGAAALIAIIAMIVFASKGSNGNAAAAGPRIVEAGPALAAVDSGWITDWGAEPGVRRMHEISVLRPSLNVTDYRVTFQAEIDNKALGWVYRAKDDKNYYVNRIEIVKPGLNPSIALVRFAVIDGEEQPRAQFPLAMAVHIDTLYKIRFDAVGDRFTTYVQDQKVDEWTDGRIKTGGVGLYNERGERMSLKGGFSVVPLVIRK